MKIRLTAGHIQQMYDIAFHSVEDDGDLYVLAIDDSGRLVMYAHDHPEEPDVLGREGGGNG